MRRRRVEWTRLMDANDVTEVLISNVDCWVKYVSPFLHHRRACRSLLSFFLSSLLILEGRVVPRCIGCDRRVDS